MNITYNDQMKDLPFEQLHELFSAVGWSGGGTLTIEFIFFFWLN
jgi:hypothetical protein